MSFTTPHHAFQRAVWPAASAVVCGMAAALLIPAASASSGHENLELIRDLVAQQVQQRTSDLPGRVVVSVSPPDPRLQLPACAAPQMTVPAGQRLWGHSQVRVQCPTAGGWQLNLGVRVQVLVDTVAPRAGLPAGHVLRADNLQPAVADLTNGSGQAWVRAEDAVGKVLRTPAIAGRPLLAGQLRPPHAVRQGGRVWLSALSNGVRVTSQAVALGDAPVGAAVGVRTDTGRIVQGQVVGEASVEVPL